MTVVKILGLLAAGGLWLYWQRNPWSRPDVLRAAFLSRDGVPPGMRYRHPVNEFCKPLNTVGQYDVYAQIFGMQSVLIARYGNGPNDFVSGNPLELFDVEGRPDEVCVMKIGKVNLDDPFHDQIVI